ncbi:MAG TPA: Rap1a/Tai family immunity protein [Candidatus Acidoferrales bacterium]|nr:Rap1a/Tai family immunity protein [Candidatus Acidoferrales bacterium]
MNKLPVYKAVVVLMFLSLAIPVIAQNESAAKDLSESGRVFFNTCAVIDRPVSALTVGEAIPYVHCVSYVGAIFDTMALYDSIGIGPHNFCAPEQQRVQRDGLVRTVRKYITAHPEISNEQTVYVVRLALLDEFSCRSAKR